MSKSLFQKSVFILFLSLCFSLPGNSQAAIVSSESIMPGDYIQVENSPAIYYVTANRERQYFLSARIFKCYQNDYSRVKQLSKQTNLDDVAPSATIGVVAPKAGCGLVKSPSSPSVYAFDNQGTRHKIKDEATARALYGAEWSKQVYDMPDFIVSLFPIGNQFDETSPQTLTVIRTSVVTSQSGEPGFSSVGTSTSKYNWTINCGSADCFDKKFAACEPAEGIADLSVLSKSRYTIISKSATGCNVKIEYLYNFLSEDLNNKPMTCSLNNKINFDQSVSLPMEEIALGAMRGTSTNTYNCEGPLLSEMIKVYSKFGVNQ